MQFLIFILQQTLEGQIYFEHFETVVLIGTNYTTLHFQTVCFIPMDAHFYNVRRVKSFFLEISFVCIEFEVQLSQKLIIHHSDISFGRHSPSQSFGSIVIDKPDHFIVDSFA